MIFENNKKLLEQIKNTLGNDFSKQKNNWKKIFSTSLKSDDHKMYPESYNKTWNIPGTVPQSG